MQRRERPGHIRYGYPHKPSRKNSVKGLPGNVNRCPIRSGMTDRSGISR